MFRPTMKVGSLKSVVILAFLVGVIAPQGARAQGQRPSAPVTVVNTPTNPVPVSGTVTVGDVQVGNPATNPVLVKDLLEIFKEPFTGIVELRFSNGSPVCGEVAVPTGKRLVIEHVSGRFDASGAGNMQKVVYYTVGEAYVGPPVLAGLVGGLLEPVYVFSQPIRLYSDDTVSVCGYMTRPASGYSAVTVSGFLVTR